MRTIRIRPATVRDAVGLSVFAAQIFAETFGGDNSPEDMAAYLSTRFMPERQALEITDPTGFVLLAVSDANPHAEPIVGYAYVTGGETSPCVRGPAPIYLVRFYVASAWHGHGIAQLLMEHLCQRARDRGAQTLWLGVWERNVRAIAFYHKCGFQKVGTRNFRLGNDLKTDWVMECPLDVLYKDSSSSGRPQCVRATEPRDTT